MAQPHPTLSDRSAPHRVLEALRQLGPMTASELAKHLGGGPVAARVHLRNLLAAGLVTHEEVRQRVGRPSRRFALTAEADAHFPKQYAAYAVALTEAVAEQLGPAALEKVLDDWLAKLTVYLDHQLPKEADARLKALARHQSSYGFMASVKSEAAGQVLLERNCPLAAVAVRFPAVCDYEARLFSRVLGKKVELRCCQAKGDRVCEFLQPAAA